MEGTTLLMYAIQNSQWVSTLCTYLLKVIQDIEQNGSCSFGKKILGIIIVIFYYDLAGVVISGASIC